MLIDRLLKRPRRHANKGARNVKRLELQATAASDVPPQIARLEYRKAPAFRRP